MERLDGFTLARPATLDEAIAVLARDPGARPIAGGTDLVPNLRHGLGRPATLVDLANVDGLATIEHRSDGAIAIGAATTLARIARDARIAGDLPALHEAVVAIAGPSHRSAATLGGNLCLDTRCTFYNQSAWWRASNGYCLKHGGTTCHVAPQGRHCHAAYAGDAAPALIALGATVALAGPAGTRTLPLEALYADDGAKPLELRFAELVTAVHVPAQPAHAASGYRKVRARGAIDFPLAGVAARLVVDAGRIVDLRVALTGTNSRPLLLDGTAALAGSTPDEEALAALARLVQQQAKPMRTTAMGAHWRRVAAAVTARRLVADLAAVPDR